jgi:predicted 2-oxoglutarate/Fe(II)-dependent dioxygenase YbiX
MDGLIQIVKVLNEDEVDEINAYADSHLCFTQSTTFDGLNTKIDAGRTSVECALREDEDITKKIHSRLNEALVDYKRRILNIHPCFNKHPLPGADDTTSWREGVRIIQYEEGQHYGFHHDQGTMRCRQEYHREISVILYLTDDFEGGETAFINASFKPKKGEAVIFPANWCFLHQGNPVTKGKKRIAVTWYYVDSKN